MTPNDLLSTADVAEIVGASESTLRHWRHVGVGPTGFKIGRRVRYRRRDVDSWLELQYATTAVGDSP